MSGQTLDIEPAFLWALSMNCSVNPDRCLISPPAVLSASSSLDSSNMYTEVFKDFFSSFFVF